MFALVANFIKKITRIQEKISGELAELKNQSPEPGRSEKTLLFLQNFFDENLKTKNLMLYGFFEYYGCPGKIFCTWGIHEIDSSRQAGEVNVICDDKNPDSKEIDMGNLPVLSVKIGVMDQDYKEFFTELREKLESELQS